MWNKQACISLWIKGPRDSENLHPHGQQRSPQPCTRIKCCRAVEAGLKISQKQHVCTRYNRRYEHRGTALAHWWEWVLGYSLSCQKVMFAERQPAVEAGRRTLFRHTTKRLRGGSSCLPNPGHNKPSQHNSISHTKTRCGQHRHWLFCLFFLLKNLYKSFYSETDTEIWDVV